MADALKTHQIEEQKNHLLKGATPVKLNGPCRLNDGIIRHSEKEKANYISTFLNKEQKICFFIPASGSGSRMFQFLYQFLSYPSEKTVGKTEYFLNKIESFAFFQLLPFSIKKEIRENTISFDDFITYILREKGLGLGEIPKGLVPFHRSRSFILNAFQEQLLQGLRIKETELTFHFTVNKNYLNTIKTSLKSIQLLTGRGCNIEYSTQNPDTNSVAFDENKEVVRDKSGNLLRRPSGHGALLDNLNQIDGDIIFIKNIDNVQHEAKAKPSIINLRYLGGVLNQFKKELKVAYNQKNNAEALHELNTRYHFMHPSTDFQSFSDEEITTLAHRPIRICGMVRNEGQPGGGPFWEEINGRLTKQIIEKSQIKHDDSLYRLMIKGQYFNPVLMAVSTRSIEGKKLDITQFSNDSKFILVEKTNEGKKIQFVERPGLWNGGMENWLSVFVEVPSETFTPVKNILDLLNPSHLE